MDCDDWSVASLKGQSGRGGESCTHLRRVARSGRQRGWCFRRAIALLRWTRQGVEGNDLLMC